VVHVDERDEIPTKDALTGMTIDPPLLTGRELALGKRRWWVGEWRLTPLMGVPVEIANRRNAIFYWSYDSLAQPTLMRFLVRDPARPSNAELSEEISRRFNVLHEKTLPNLSKVYKGIDDRLKRMEDMWTKAPELVYRPVEDDIVVCTNNELRAPPKPLYREGEQEIVDKLQEEHIKDFKERDYGNHALLVSLVEYLKKVDVRLIVLEGKVEDQQKLWASMAHLQEQMTRVFEHLRIKPLDKKPSAKPAPPGTPAGGKLPVRSKEAP